MLKLAQKIIFLSLLILSTAKATELSVENSEVEAMLDQMVSQGTITAEEAQQAKIRAREMNGQEWNGLVHKAQKVMDSGHKSKETIYRSIASEEEKIN